MSGFEVDFKKVKFVDFIFLNDKEEILFERIVGDSFGLVEVQTSDFESFKSLISNVFYSKFGVEVSEVFSNRVIVSGIELKFGKVYEYRSNLIFYVEFGGNFKKFLELVFFSKRESLQFFNRSDLPKLVVEHSKFVSDFLFFLKDYALKAVQKISVTVDVAIFTVSDGILKVLMFKRSKEPFKNSFTLPGAFLEEGLDLEDNAKKILKRDVGISGFYLEQLFTFGELKRDPRGRILSTAYYALIDSSKINVNFSKKYVESRWVNVCDVDRLDVGFDHEKIVKYGYERMKNKIEYTNIAFQLLSDKFTLAELQEVYEVILEKEIDKRNFRKKVFEQDLVEELDEFKKQGRMRPARYYRFKV